MKLVKHKTPYLIFKFENEIHDMVNIILLDIDDSIIRLLKKYDATAQVASNTLEGKFCSLEIEESICYFLTI